MTRIWKRICVYIWITDSLHCLPETNITLWINCTSIKKKNYRGSTRNLRSELWVFNHSKNLMSSYYVSDMMASTGPKKWSIK